METIKQSAGALNLAAAVIKRGGVVICPTDTVYGFLAVAGNKKAVETIYKIKKRTRLKPLPVFVRDIEMAKQIAEIDAKQEKILRKYWPGKYTFILNSKRKTQNAKPQLKTQKLYGVAKDTIALRIPKYKFLNDLLKKINKPLAQTSVNMSGEPPLTKIENIKTRFTQNLVRSDLAKFLLLIIDGGDLKRAKPSKIINLAARHLTRIR